MIYETVPAECDAYLQVCLCDAAESDGQLIHHALGTLNLCQLHDAVKLKTLECKCQLFARNRDGKIVPVEVT
jgi:hypothetical protein